MRSQAGRLGAAELSRAADVVHAGLLDMRGTTSARLLLELTLARALLPSASSDSAAMQVRLDRLERRLAVTGTPDPAPAVAPPVAATEGPVPGSAPTAPSAAAQASAGSEAGHRPSPDPDAPSAREQARAAAARAGQRSPAPAPRQEQPQQPRPEPAEQPRQQEQPEQPRQEQPRQEQPRQEPPRPPAERPDPWATPAAPPSSPAAAAVPAPASASAAGTVDVAAIRRVWDEILRAVGREKRTPHAILLTAEVAEVRGNELVLTFTGPMARNYERSQDADRVLRKVLTDVVGGSWRVTAQVARPGSPPTPSGGSSSGSAAGSGPAPSPAGPASGPSSPPEPPPMVDEPSADDEDMPEMGGGGAHDPVALLTQGLGAQVIDERDAG
jgi:DNA polymerase-3 subunit gamma/tau